MTPVISIIVAVYKAESCLRRCVDSLLAQTFQDYEILLVDDGSPIVHADEVWWKDAMEQSYVITRDEVPSME